MAQKTQTNGQTALHFATDNHVKKNGIFSVPWSLLDEEADFNDRKDFGTAEEMNELMESIYSQGPRVPLRGKQKNGRYVVYVGHRRMQAGAMAFKKYGVDVLFPMVMYPPQATRKDILLDTLLTNGGKDLNPLEKSANVGKLMGEGMTDKEIAAALGGVSLVYVKSLQSLDAAPEKAKKLILDGTISPTYLIQEMKKKDFNLEEFIAKVLEAAKGAKPNAKKKAAKVTKANVEKREKANTKAASSLGEFKRFRKTGNDIFENKAKQEAFEFICSMIDNQVSYSQILGFFTGK